MTSIHSSFPDRGQAGAPLLNNHETAGWRDAVGGHPLSTRGNSGPVFRLEGSNTVGMCLRTSKRPSGSGDPSLEGHSRQSSSGRVSRAAYRPTGARGRAGALHFLPAHRLTYVGIV